MKIEYSIFLEAHMVVDRHVKVTKFYVIHYSLSIDRVPAMDQLLF